MSVHFSQLLESKNVVTYIKKWNVCPALEVSFPVVPSFPLYFYGNHFLDFLFTFTQVFTLIHCNSAFPSLDYEYVLLGMASLTSYSVDV